MTPSPYWKTSTWITTMSTNNPSGDSTLRDFVPDAAVIARLANDFLSAMPAYPAAPSAASVLSGQPPIPSLVPAFSPAAAAPAPGPGGPSGSLVSVQPFGPAQVPLSGISGPLGPESLAALPSGLGTGILNLQPPASDFPFTEPSLPTGTDARAFSFLAPYPDSEKEKIGEPSAPKEQSDPRSGGKKQDFVPGPTPYP